MSFTIETQELRCDVRKYTGKDYNSGKDYEIKKKVIPVSLLEIKATDKTYHLVLPGEHNLKNGDGVNLDYLVDNEVTPSEIWNMCFPTTIREYFHSSSRPVAFKADGVVTNYRKK